MITLYMGITYIVARVGSMLWSASTLAETASPLMTADSASMMSGGSRQGCRYGSSRARDYHSSEWLTRPTRERGLGRTN